MQMIPQGGGHLRVRSLHSLATDKFEIRMIALSGGFGFVWNCQGTLEDEFVREHWEDELVTEPGEMKYQTD